MNEIPETRPNVIQKSTTKLWHVSEIAGPEIRLSFLNGTATISSLTVAELFEKRPDHVLEAIRDIIKRSKKEGGLPLGRETSYVDQWNRRQPSYDLTRDGFMFLTMGFTGDKADEWKWKVIARFNKLEEDVRRFQAAGIRMDSPALVDALFDGQLTVFRANQIQDFPEEQRAEILALPKREIARTIKEIRQELADKNAQERAKVREEALSLALPEGKYRTIIIDPPWDMHKIERDLRPNQTGFDYPTMTEDQLSTFDVGGAAYDDCHLYLWTTQKHLPVAFRLMEKWDFRYIFTMVWHKPGGPQPFGLPQYNCEFVIFGRKGGFGFLDTKAFPTCFQAPRREHSRKPDEFYDLVRRVSPGPRIDIFSREERDGFDTWGAETGMFAGE